MIKTIEMRNAIFALGVSLFFCCQNEPISHTVSLTGEITKPTSDKVNIYGANDFEEEAEVDNGTFTMEFEIPESGYYRFKHGREYSSIFLSPGDALLMTLDTDEFDESISFEGKGAESNNFLAAKYLHEEEAMEDFSYKEVFSQDEADFLEEINGIYTEKKKLLKSYNHKTVLPEDFYSLEDAAIRFERGERLLSYAPIHNHFNEEANIKNSERLLNEVRRLPLNDPSFLKVSAFKDFIESFTEAEANERLGLTSEEVEPMAMYQETFDVIPAKLENEDVRNYAYYASMRSAMYYGVNDATKALYKTFKEVCTDADYRKEIGDSYEKWAAIASGEEAPGFTYPDIHGTNVSLSEWKGKAVYIDVWATWCGPCRKELPHLEALQESYANDARIVFASISIDDDKAAWEKMVREKEMKGVQLIADKAWDSQINEDYNISGIPRFILIDKDGKIVEANAPRPSSKHIKEKLDILLNGKKS